VGRGCAPSQKIYEFFISKWCDMMHSGCVVFKIHVSHGSWLYDKLYYRKKIKTLVKILGGRQHRKTLAGQILGGSRPLQPLRR